LNFLKKWVEELPENTSTDKLDFDYVHNDHVHPIKYFEILINFWEHPNELLLPALQLAFSLIEKDGHQLPEVLKFLDDKFSYKWEDVMYGFTRQHIVLDFLIEGINTKSPVHRGIFLKLAYTLLGWRYTQYTGAKGMAFTMRNFDLFVSEDLLLLRKKILETFIDILEVNCELSDNVLSRIVRPGGSIDRKIYIHEIQLYGLLVKKSLKKESYAHCKFVKGLIRIFTKEGQEYPKEWDGFTDSEVMKLSEFLKLEWDFEKGKSYDDRRNEKIDEVHKYVVANDDQNIRQLLSQIENLLPQVKDNTEYFIEDCVTEIFIALVQKDKDEFAQLLLEYFNKPIELPLNNRLINYILSNHCTPAKELFDILGKNTTNTSDWWLASFLSYLPQEEITVDYLENLLAVLNRSTSQLPFWDIKDLYKYQGAFEEYLHREGKDIHSGHNIVTLTTEILLSKKDIYKAALGWKFFSSCKGYFANHVHLFKEAYFYSKENFRASDYEGKEFNAVFELDNDFLMELVGRKLDKEKYPTFRNEDYKLDVLWCSSNYYETVSSTLEFIIDKVPIFSNIDHAANILFNVRNQTVDFTGKAISLIEDFINKHYNKEQHILVIINVIQHTFPDYFIQFLKQVFLLNPDVGVFKKMFLTKFGVYTGSRVPHIQWEIDLCNDILTMVKGLPKLLVYSGHIEYLEQRVVWLKDSIIKEQKEEFREQYDF